MIQNNNKGETLISIVVVIVIIAVILLALTKIIEVDNKGSLEYQKINTKILIENNTKKIIEKVDTSELNENDIFYLYKTGSEIKVFTGSENEDYKFINYLGEYVHSGSYRGDIYTRFCLVEMDSQVGQGIKCSIKEMIRK